MLTHLGTLFPELESNRTVGFPNPAIDQEVQRFWHSIKSLELIVDSS